MDMATNVLRCGSESPSLNGPHPTLPSTIASHVQGVEWDVQWALNVHVGFVPWSLWIVISVENKNEMCYLALFPQKLLRSQKVAFHSPS